MLKLVSTVLKITLFAAAVLVAGQIIHWDGRTLSDQVRIGMAHAERGEAFHRAQRWAKELQKDASKGIGKKLEEKPVQESIGSSERQRLKELINELNGVR